MKEWRGWFVLYPSLIPLFLNPYNCSSPTHYLSHLPHPLPSSLPLSPSLLPSPSSLYFHLFSPLLPLAGLTHTHTHICSGWLGWLSYWPEACWGREERGVGRESVCTDVQMLCLVLPLGGGVCVSAFWPELSSAEGSSSEVERTAHRLLWCMCDRLRDRLGKAETLPQFRIDED